MREKLSAYLGSSSREDKLPHGGLRLQQAMKKGEMPLVQALEEKDKYEPEKGGSPCGALHLHQ